MHVNTEKGKHINGLLSNEQHEKGSTNLSYVLLQKLQMYHLNEFLNKVIYGIQTLAQNYSRQKMNTLLAKRCDIILQKQLQLLNWNVSSKSCFRQ